MIRDLEDKVMQVLTESPATRNDDWLLISLVYQKFYNIGSLSFYDTMRLHKDLKLPAFESITRCRRKLQEKYPTRFRSSEDTMHARKEQEYQVYDYAKGRS